MTHDARDTERAVLHRSGLFLATWYLDRNPDVAAAGIDPLVHFCAAGWREGRQPNPYFDPAWYLEQNPDAGNPLLHYVRDGEHQGRRPILWFDPGWYRTTHDVPPNVSALVHFLAHRSSGAVSPIPEFDAAWYLGLNPDVAAAGIDPFEHYRLQGFREGRHPSPAFDTRFYRTRYLQGRGDENPLIHYLQHRDEPGIHPSCPPEETSAAREVRRNTRPGPYFEARRPLPDSAIRRALVLAYYLPQFHAVPENDAWWGAGFTEWTNVTRGQPRFAGHYQPRIPRDLGHYDLRDPNVMRRQIAMARQGGIGGFVFYFYWFNGRRLLDAPLEAFLADRTLDFPFCLMWANENWTRRWDGSEDEVLISQDYRATDEAALIATFARHFADPRHIRLDGRPLLMVYRPALIPDTANTIARWRTAFRSAGEDPVFVMAQSFNATDPRPFGLDGAVEFPPHKLTVGLPTKNAALHYLDPDFTAQVLAYEDVAAASLAEAPPPFPLIKTAVPGWDNDARRQGGGMVLHGATPDAYQAWLDTLVARAQEHPFFGTPIVCVNAWNEWAEGAYLEPDVHFGAAFLNATGRAAAGLHAAGCARLLLVGHDAFPAGAQHLLLHLGRRLHAGHGVEVAFLLCGGGEMERVYAEVAPTEVCPDAASLAARLDGFAARGFSAAIVNTAAAAHVVPELRARGIAATLLLHEMPNLLRERRLMARAARGAAAAQRVVFAAPAVRDRFTALASLRPTTCAILPQGIYQPVAFSAAARIRLRAALGIADDAPIAIGAGHADHRKGFDLFLRVFAGVSRHAPAAHFIWLGTIEPGTAARLSKEIGAAVATGRCHLPGWQQNVGDWLSAADVFVLTSREDPFPSVVLEAMAAGLPSLAFADSGGIPDMLREYGAGEIVAQEDAVAMAARVPVLATPRSGRRERLARLARAHFAFDRYTAELLHLAQPAMPQISVVVPNYNYSRYLRERMATIFAQSHPVAEVIVLDDASTDSSVEVVRNTARDWQRAVRVQVNAANSGSVFLQWHRAAEAARGEWLWIAEADDASDPRFLETLAGAIARVPDAVLGFTDSRAIDTEGRTLWPSYKDYCAKAGADLLQQDAVLPGRMFLRRCLAERNLIPNASAVLWRRTALLDALDRCGKDLASFRMAGDWRLYVELLAGTPGSVVYVAEPLNRHRRHSHSVTHALDAARHVDEIARMHRIVADRLDERSCLATRQARYRTDVARQLGRAAGND